MSRHSTTANSSIFTANYAKKDDGSAHFAVGVCKLLLLVVVAVGCGFVLLLIVIGWVNSSASSTPADTLSYFSSNARRRDPTLLEDSYVARVDNGCTAFFVENTQGRTLMASARHCFNNSVGTWCNRRGKVLFNDRTPAGECRRVIAADHLHDIAMFEVKLSTRPVHLSTLRLAGYAPARGTRLVMIGYPADRDPMNPRLGSITTTDNCWVLYSNVASPHREYHDVSAVHNCSTYGGNSGGPMIREGSRDVVGLPFTYRPNDYQRRGPNDVRHAAYLAEMGDFVQVHRHELEQAGVVISR